MSEGWFVLFGAVVGGTISALTTLLVEWYKNKNIVSVRIREQRESLYLEFVDALYKCLDANTLNNRYDLDYLLKYFVKNRQRFVLFASSKVLSYFKSFFDYIESLEKAEPPLTKEQTELIGQKILTLINILRNDLQINKNEFLGEN